MMFGNGEGVKMCFGCGEKAHLSFSCFCAAFSLVSFHFLSKSSTDLETNEGAFLSF
jgi:hypothetical protein